MRRYFARKLLIYVLTFFVAVTINWMIPRLVPGDPIQGMVARAGAQTPEAAAAIRAQYTEWFGLDVPLLEQYLRFWADLLGGDLGVSMWLFPASVRSVILTALPYTLGLLLPAILLSWWAGNKFGAYAARRKVLDNAALPIWYVLTATPYMWLAILLLWSLGIVANVFPTAGGYGFLVVPTWSLDFVGNLALHWFLPFASLFLVAFGGWAIGMRNLIIYELEADYSHYLQALGAPSRLVRRYAFRNAMLPQVTGLALQLGVIIGGAVVTEIVFSYPGLGYITLKAIESGDYFLLQGVFLFIVVGVLVANFIVDVVYVLVDPRTRTGVGGGRA
ncbi:MAG TPA: ABC transporter permease [Actinophytocola sp.]|uniref:ABC transporter permease n=1 Tax=Actinophytocola sp. TaxID=1872138 RepID=UPI002DDCED59|nr:ABC transporter permease [Actinophytocola sp.]HEV2778314.1 ABC transporter permease [Actinophytocola sp.]